MGYNIVPHMRHMLPLSYAEPHTLHDLFYIFVKWRLYSAGSM